MSYQGVKNDKINNDKKDKKKKKANNKQMTTTFQQLISLQFNMTAKWETER